MKFWIALGRVINYNLLDYEPHFSALPFLKYVHVFCDTVLEKRGSRHKICQLMTRPRTLQISREKFLDGHSEINSETFHGPNHQDI